jgi:Protein of unknown function (DUF3037)
VPDAETFQYALLRAVPSLDRGESVNVGVVVYSPRHRFLGVRTSLDADRLRLLDPRVDVDAVQAHLRLIERVAAGEASAGPIARLGASDRFGWITAPSSTTVQPSAVHTGLSEDPERTLDELFRALVVPPNASPAE